MKAALPIAPEIARTYSSTFVCPRPTARRPLFSPHRLQSAGRRARTRNTGIPQSGTGSKCRGSRVSHPGPPRAHPEQMGRLGARATISMRSANSPKTPESFTDLYTKDLNLCTRFRSLPLHPDVLSCVGNFCRRYPLQDWGQKRPVNLPIFF
jgi:hypothetical protein